MVLMNSLWSSLSSLWLCLSVYLMLSLLLPTSLCLTHNCTCCSNSLTVLLCSC